MNISPVPVGLAAGSSVRKPAVVALFMLSLFALAPLSTKAAGLSWVLLIVWGLHASWTRPANDSLAPSPLIKSAYAWLTGLLVFGGINLFMAWGWYDGCCRFTSELNSSFRLAAAALATYSLTLYFRPWPRMTQHLNMLVMAASLAGFGLVFSVGPSPLPSNPIPWAVGMGFIVCLLVPHLFTECTSTTRRLIFVLVCAAGIGAVLLSKSRGAYGIVLWTLLLSLLHFRRIRAWSFLRLATVALVVVAFFGVAAATPSDPLRLRQAAREVQHTLQSQDYNSSLGARIYLAKLAWNTFLQSPLTGVGQTERMHILKTAGLDAPADQSQAYASIRFLGHVHNQFLHHAMDHGLMGLSGFLAMLAGMAVASYRLLSVNRVAAQQMMGLTFMHTTASLSNVNLAHNYYALMLGLCAALIWLQALAHVSDIQTEKPG